MAGKMKSSPARNKLPCRRKGRLDPNASFLTPPPACQNSRFSRFSRFFTPGTDCSGPGRFSSRNSRFSRKSRYRGKKHRNTQSGLRVPAGVRRLQMPLFQYSTLIVRILKGVNSMPASGSSGDTLSSSMLHSVSFFTGWPKRRCTFAQPPSASYRRRI